MVLCAIAIGSNLGDSQQIAIDAVAAINRLPNVQVIKISRWYRTKAVTLPITRSPYADNQSSDRPNCDHQVNERDLTGDLTFGDRFPNQLNHSELTSDRIVNGQFSDRQFNDRQFNDRQHMTTANSSAVVANAAFVKHATSPQPDYINGCAIVQTDLAPETLLIALLDIEAQFGRERRERWGARTLDLDLLLYGKIIVQLPHLVIPHPRMGDRAFVLLPLAEIAADWLHPIAGKSIAELAQDPPDLDICVPIALD